MLNRAGLTLQKYVFALKNSIPELRYECRNVHLVENIGLKLGFLVLDSRYLSSETEFFDANAYFCRVKPALSNKSTFDPITATYLEKNCI